VGGGVWGFGGGGWGLGPPPNPPTPNPQSPYILFLTIIINSFQELKKDK